MERALIAATHDRYTADPRAAQSAPATLARYANGRAELSAGTWTWHADLPVVLGGEASAPSPTAQLLGALAGSAVLLIRDTLAPQLGVTVEAITATACCRSDARALFGTVGAEAGLGDIELEIAISSPDSADGVERLYRTWLERSPIYRVLGGPAAVTSRLNLDAPATAHP